MNIILNPIASTWESVLQRPTSNYSELDGIVTQIFKEVQSKGDAAILKYTQLFDGIILENTLVTNQEIEFAINDVPNELKVAINLAKANIEKFHIAQKTEKIEVETTDGVLCWQEKRPLFSTVLMLAIPAKIANCSEIIICSPPNKKGEIHPAILYTAQLCGITKIYKVGGIQAIAAMTFGTANIPKVYKIFGPGNQFVTVAKQKATQFGVAIDMPAGPSELLIVADDSANSSFIASDLLSQAEHGTDSQVILVTTSKTILYEVEAEISKQIQNLPRKAIAEKAIANSKLIYVESDILAVALINEYGPEHLIICCENESFYVNAIENAGSVFIGNFTPESAGDYASGTNHTLPTNGFAKNYSGVNLDSFQKAMTFQKISEKGIQNIGNAIEIMAEAEGLQAHKTAVSLRLEYINNNLNSF
jgi:histidinol dehydrogenase